MSEIELAGIDGANPLGFLTALGTLRVADRLFPGVRLSWRAKGSWRPVIYADAELSQDGIATAVRDVLHLDFDRDAEQALTAARKVLQKEHKKLKDRRQEVDTEIRRQKVKPRERRRLLEERLTVEREAEAIARAQEAECRRRAYPRPDLAVEKNLNMTASEFRTVAAGIVAATPRAGRDPADFLAAFGVEVEERGKVRVTQFRFVNGGKHQDFLPSYLELAARATPDHYRRALFEPWDYRDEGSTFRWDPSEDRRYALRWSNPSSTPAGSMWGANHLAFEALPMFPCIPTSRGPATTSWQGDAFVWPIWRPSIPMNVVASLLAHPLLRARPSDRQRLVPLGIEEVYSARRIPVGKGVCNFSWGEAV